MRNHTYTVEFRFYGNEKTPAAITEFLCLQSCNCSNIPKSIRKKKNTFFWGYNGENEEGFQDEWESLEQGLNFVLQLLLPRREKIATLLQNYKGIWWCGHFQESFDGGPILSPQILAKLADFGAPLFIDNYFSDEEHCQVP